jgi:AraC-like DNA-binding protein
MNKEITPLNWLVDLKNRMGIDIQSIDDDFMMFDNLKILPAFSYPFKVDVTTFIICTQGQTCGKIGLRSYQTAAPCIIVVMANEILQYEYISEDFEGLFMSLSQRLSDNLLNIQERLPIDIFVRENPSIPLNDEDLELLKTYYGMLKKVVIMTENPHRKEIVRLLLKAFYYLSSAQLHNIPQKRQQTKHEDLVSRFFELVRKYHKTDRQVGFYAEKMYLTPKYLSQIIKANTGKSANEWIDGYVMLEAKALLKSTRMTIQQISDDLNFADQSFFGKYFKRLEGMSPKEYRRK